MPEFDFLTPQLNLTVILLRQRLLITNDQIFPLYVCGSNHGCNIYYSSEKARQDCQLLKITKPAKQIQLQSLALDLLFNVIRVNSVSNTNIGNLFFKNQSHFWWHQDQALILGACVSPDVQSVSLHYIHELVILNRVRYGHPV